MESKKKGKKGQEVGRKANGMKVRKNGFRGDGKEKGTEKNWERMILKRKKEERPRIEEEELRIAKEG
jgi:hypothetical protein